MEDTECCYKIINIQDILVTAPSTAHAIIVAELDVDQSDGMIDYYGHKTIRSVVIGWRHTKRESFKAMREAATNFPPTKHLGLSAPDSVEHRDNYSMGSGNYVKEGWTHSSGWRIRTYPLDYLKNSNASYENAIPEKTTKVIASPVTTSQIKHNTEKNGIEIYFATKPECQIIDHLKQKGYRWSKFNKCWYTGYTSEKMNYIQEYLLKTEEKQMGFYIETPGYNHNKANIIAKKFNGEVIKTCPINFEDIPVNKALIIVVDNIIFEAAGFAFDKDEFEALTLPDDPRPRQYVLISRTDALLETGYQPK